MSHQTVNGINQEALKKFCHLGVRHNKGCENDQFEERSSVVQSSFFTSYLFTKKMASRREKLIESVRARELLYLKSDDDFKDRGKVGNAWDAVGKENDMSGVEAKEEWKSLREKFIREDKKGYTASGSAAVDKAVSRWSMFAAMFFLKGHIQPRNTTSNAEKGQQPRRSPRLTSQGSPSVPKQKKQSRSVNSSRSASPTSTISNDADGLLKSLQPELSIILSDSEKSEKEEKTPKKIKLQYKSKASKAAHRSHKAMQTKPAVDVLEDQQSSNASALFQVATCMKSVSGLLTQNSENVNKGLQAFGSYVANTLHSLPRDLQIKARSAIQSELSSFEIMAFEREQ